MRNEKLEFKLSDIPHFLISCFLFLIFYSSYFQTPFLYIPKISRDAVKGLSSPITR